MVTRKMMCVPRLCCRKRLRRALNAARAVFCCGALTRPRRRRWGAFLRWRAQNGWTPLYTAARRGNASLCKLLLDSGADFNARNDVRGVRAAVAAHEPPHLRAIAPHLSATASVAAAQDGQTALDHATLAKDHATLAVLHAWAAGQR